MNFNQLRSKHAQFIYKGLEISTKGKDLKVVFNFLLAPDIVFKPKVIFLNIPKERVNSISPKVLENLVFNVGMVELLSYWKAACPKQIIIKAGYLNAEQIEFWKKLLIKGLGEFFYNNKIDYTKKDLIEFKIFHPRGDFILTPQDLKDRDLVLVGGGKDSAVTLELIRKKRKEFNCLLLNPTEAALKMVKLGGAKKPIIIKRTLDPKLLELNKADYLNGHTPFSAYLAFLSVFAGVLYNYKNLIVSNEASSNEGNVIWMGQEINHQYSKSSEFEKDFRNYAKNYLESEINYFSFLRRLGELQISKLFSKMEKYHKLFRSCNKGSKQGIWCGRCPKCISTYITLYPFLGDATQRIFRKNLLEDKSLIPIVKGLLGQNRMVKPFECVATYDEIKTAIALGLERAIKEGEGIPKVLQDFKR